MSQFVQTEGSVSAHWQALRGEFASVLPANQKIYFDNPSSGDTFATQLGGEQERRFERRVSVAKGVPFLADRTGRVRYWLSYYEQWNRIDARRSVEFHTASLTFYLTDGDQPPVQIFRAEWPGFRDWTTGMAGWQSPGAGHPHWQFDAIASYIEARQAEAEKLAALQRVTGPPIVDFAVALAAEELATTPVLDASWSSAHFAMQAKWSSVVWTGDPENCECHASAPANLQQIRRWVVSAARYSRHELLRADRNAISS